MSNLSSRPALGQEAEIGAFYDARRDCFLPKSFFNGPPPNEVLVQQDVNKIGVEIVPGESYDQKFKTLQIGPDLATSMLCDLVRPGGLGDYLLERNESGNRLQASIYHTVTSCQVKLNMPSLVDRSSVPHPTLKQSEVTHMVAEIDYGAQTIMTLNHWRRDDSFPDREDSHFKTRVEAFVDLVKKSGAFKVGQNDETFDQIIAYSSVLGSDELVLNGNDEARAFLDLVPIQMTSSNDGKGHPITYRLVPIDMLIYLNLANVQMDGPFTPPAQECLKKFIEGCDDFRRCKKPLEEYELFAAKYDFCLPRDHLNDVAQRITRLAKAEREMKSKFANILVEVRLGVTDPHRLWQFVNEASTGDNSPMTISSFNEDYQGKVAFIDSMMNQGAIYIGYNAINLSTQLNQRRDEDVYVFFFSEEAQRDQTSWTENQTVMLQLLKARPPNSFFAIVDCDATNHIAPRAVIHQFRNGTSVVEDVCAEQQYLANHCFAKYRSLETDKVQKPTKRRFVKIPCPGRNCSSGNICEWKCQTCRAPIEYGFTDQYMYCDCGRSLYTNFTFKCNVSTHGPGYEMYEDRRLMEFLKTLTTDDYLNVLILGETGVGKSTFINAFVNYLYFSSLDEALASEDLNYVIPCSFATQTMDRSNVDSDIVETRITVGARDDEQDGSRGASATQRTQVYPITVGTTTYRLIDTPGIGDTRGLQYDKTNMADILSTVSGYDELHGILILLKSNNARLTAHFSFCVKELLMHLHKDATENVVFGFTNTRISNYMPGDTFGSLKTLLEARKDIGLSLSTKVTYCFDSESFRFLAAAKNGVILDNKPEFESSWAKSSTEAERMLDFFRTRKPHPIKNTTSLNSTRNMISELTKPMAKISQIIKVNIDLLTDEMKELADAKLTGDKLRNKLQPEKQLLKTKPLDKPRTVCSDIKCTKFTDDGTGTMLTDYPYPCHPVCYLTGVTIDVHAHPGLIKCSAFKGRDVCLQCGHHWNMHLHILYELESYITKVKDVGIEEQIKKHASDLTLKQTGIQQREQMMREYNKELDEIREAAAKFGLWMKANSILPYNDATLAYLDVLINDEQMKADAGGTNNKKRVEQLKEDVRKHKELVSILTASMKSTGKEAPLNQIEVQALVQKLYRLKHFGQNLQELKLGITESHERTYREQPHRVKNKPAQHHRAATMSPQESRFQQNQYGPQQGRPMPQNRNLAQQAYNMGASPYSKQQMDKAFASATMRTSPQYDRAYEHMLQQNSMPGGFNSQRESSPHFIERQPESSLLPMTMRSATLRKEKPQEKSRSWLNW